MERGGAKWRLELYFKDVEGGIRNLNERCVQVQRTVDKHVRTSTAMSHSQQRERSARARTQLAKGTATLQATSRFTP
jgi:hypothetical protein